ncbi:MAG: chemotaxis protein CheW [Deltaproteobacteria bacterium]|nr:chemotaxis protein CheW [Deltaproteobacteria bacterium]
MAQPAGAKRPVLLVRAGGLRVALRATDVIETFRPLPVEPIAGAPAFVRGLVVVRGAAAPLVALGTLLGGRGGEGARFVAIRAGELRAVLEVDEVIGVRHLDDEGLAGAPPLLGAAVSAFVDTLGTHDGQLLAVLAAARVISDAHEAVA